MNSFQKHTSIKQDCCWALLSYGASPAQKMDWVLSPGSCLSGGLPGPYVLICPRGWWHQAALFLRNRGQDCPKWHLSGLRQLGWVLLPLHTWGSGVELSIQTRWWVDTQSIECFLLHCAVARVSSQAMVTGCLRTCHMPDTVEEQ